MPILPKNWDLDLDLVNILIKKEREERERQNNAHERPFLQLPTPEPPLEPEMVENIKKEEKDDTIIIIDI
jgi:hypothetical protein